MKTWRIEFDYEDGNAPEWEVVAKDSPPNIREAYSLLNVPDELKAMGRIKIEPYRILDLDKDELIS